MCVCGGFVIVTALLAYNHICTPTPWDLPSTLQKIFEGSFPGSHQPHTHNFMIFHACSSFSCKIDGLPFEGSKLHQQWTTTTLHNPRSTAPAASSRTVDCELQWAAREPGWYPGCTNERCFSMYELNLLVHILYNYIYITYIQFAYT